MLLDWGVRDGVFTQALAENLYNDHLVIPIFHSLPKVHKNVFLPPLRPIVAGIGSLGENLGAWLDHML